MYAIRTIRIVQAAEAHMGKGSMSSSAQLCAADARRCYEEGDAAGAERRGLRSLEYSLGIFSPVYQALAG